MRLHRKNPALTVGLFYSLAAQSKNKRYGLQCSEDQWVTVVKVVIMCNTTFIVRVISYVDNFPP